VQKQRNCTTFLQSRVVISRDKKLDQIERAFHPMQVEIKIAHSSLGDYFILPVDVAAAGACGAGPTARVGEDLQSTRQYCSRPTEACPSGEYLARHDENV
jgi:hypothetical protein